VRAVSVDTDSVEFRVTTLAPMVDALIVLAFTVLTLRMFVQFITEPTPLVRTYEGGTKVDNDMIYRGEK
jgi:hypothetical protein